MKCEKCHKQAMYTVRGLCEECVMPPDEMRFLRREKIGTMLKYSDSMSTIKCAVRITERLDHGFELKVY
jgi:hypothetical protein